MDETKKFMGTNKNCNQLSNVSSKNDIISLHNKYGDHETIMAKEFIKFCNVYFQNDEIIKARQEIENSVHKLYQNIANIKAATLQEIENMQMKQQLGLNYNKLILPMKQAQLSVLDNITCQQAYQIWNVVSNRKSKKSYTEKIDPILKSFYENAVKAVSSTFKDIQKSMLKTKKSSQVSSTRRQQNVQDDRGNRRPRRQDRYEVDDEEPKRQTKRPREQYRKPKRQEQKKQQNNERKPARKFIKQDRMPRRQQIRNKQQEKQKSRDKSKRSRYQSVESRKSQNKPTRRQNKRQYNKYQRQQKQYQSRNNKSKPKERKDGQIIPIDQLKNFKGGDFKIKVKVLEKLERTFEFKGKTKCILRVGDQTGIAEFVCNEDYSLEVDDVFIAKDCRVFTFKGTKQIQDSQTTTIKITADKQFKVKTSYNFSTRKNNNRYRGNRGGHHQRGGNHQRGGLHDRGQRRPLRRANGSKKDDSYSQSNNFDSKSQSNFENDIQEKLSDQAGSDFENISITKASITKEQKPTKFIKIKDIEPGQENISFIAQIFNIKSVKTHYECLLADETGCVEAILPSLSIIRQKATIQLIGVDSDVLNQHIKITTNSESKLESSCVKIPQINLNNKISQFTYEQIDDD